MIKDVMVRLDGGAADDVRLAAVMQYEGGTSGMDTARMSIERDGDMATDEPGAR